MTQYNTVYSCWNCDGLYTTDNLSRSDKERLYSRRWRGVRCRCPHCGAEDIHSDVCGFSSEGTGAGGPVIPLDIRTLVENDLLARGGK